MARTKTNKGKINKRVKKSSMKHKRKSTKRMSLRGGASNGKKTRSLLRWSWKTKSTKPTTSTTTTSTTTCKPEFTIRPEDKPKLTENGWIETEEKGVCLFIRIWRTGIGWEGGEKEREELLITNPEVNQELENISRLKKHGFNPLIDKENTFKGYRSPKAVTDYHRINILSIEDYYESMDSLKIDEELIPLSLKRISEDPDFKFLTPRKGLENTFKDFYNYINDPKYKDTLFILEQTLKNIYIKIENNAKLKKHIKDKIYVYYLFEEIANDVMNHLVKNKQVKYWDEFPNIGTTVEEDPASIDSTITSQIKELFGIDEKKMMTDFKRNRYFEKQMIPIAETDFRF
jgi:hypothetical protein